MLLCGYPPFFADDLTELFTMIMRAQYSFPSPEWDVIAPAAKDLIRGLLNTDPVARLTAAQVRASPSECSRFRHPVWVPSNCLLMASPLTAQRVRALLRRTRCSSMSG